MFTKEEKKRTFYIPRYGGEGSEGNKRNRSYVLGGWFWLVVFCACVLMLMFGAAELVMELGLV